MAHEYPTTRSPPHYTNSSGLTAGAKSLTPDSANSAGPDGNGGDGDNNIGYVNGKRLSTIFPKSSSPVPPPIPPHVGVKRKPVKRVPVNSGNASLSTSSNYNNGGGSNEYSPSSVYSGPPLSPSESGSSAGGGHTSTSGPGFHTPPLTYDSSTNVSSQQPPLSQQQQSRSQSFTTASSSSSSSPAPQQQLQHDTFPNRPPSPNPQIKPTDFTEQIQPLQPQKYHPQQQPQQQYGNSYYYSNSNYYQNNGYPNPDGYTESLHSVDSSASLGPIYMKTSADYDSNNFNMNNAQQPQPPIPPPHGTNFMPQAHEETMVPPPPPPPQPSAPPPQPHHQHSSSHSSIYGQNVSGNNNSSNNENSELGVGTGSKYVKEMRKKSGTVWCDVSSKVWGLPIGVAERASGSYSALAPSKGYLRKAMDIRHSHLTPRLLASEVEDDDEDEIVSPAADNASISRGGLGHSSGGSVSTIRTPTMDQASVASAGSHDNNNTTSLSNTNNNNSHKAQTRERANSGSSTKSVEEEVGKIKLFVANPDTDDDD